jgi:hypothetical protein
MARSTLIFLTKSPRSAGVDCGFSHARNRVAAQRQQGTSGLKLQRVGKEDEDDKHVGGKGRAISRPLWRIIDGIEHEAEEEESASSTKVRPECWIRGFAWLRCYSHRTSLPRFIYDDTLSGDPGPRGAYRFRPSTPELETS